MRSLTLFLFFLLLGGCATIETRTSCNDNSSNCESTIVSKKITDGSIETGVVYAIPKQLIEFSLVRTKITKAKLKKNLETAIENEKSAKALVNKQEKIIIKDLKTKLSSAKSTEAKAKVSLELEIANLDLIVLKNKYNEAKSKLSLASTLLSKFKEEHYQDEIKFTSLSPVPDSKNRFAAKINRSPFSSETIEIKTTENGLLSGGSGTSEGQIDEIFIDLVKAISAFKAVSFGDKPLFFTGLSPKDSNKCSSKEIKLKHTFDLRDDKFESNLNKLLAKDKLCYSVNLVSENPSKTAPLKDGVFYDGLVYPRKTALQFNLYKTDVMPKEYLKSFYPTVIDSRSLGIIPLKKGYFATNKYEFEFKNGLLTKYKAITPNELVDFLGMFPKAAKAVVSIPAEIIQLKIDYSSAEEGYYQAQQAALEARLAYEKAIEEQSTADGSE